MSRIPILRRAGEMVRVGGLAFSIVLAGLSGPALAAASDVAPGLEAPMQPINKAGAAASVCQHCVDTDPQDGNGQRVAERAAPEYAAPRRTMTMTMPLPRENEGGLTPQLDPVVPEVIDTGSLLSLPGASITLPAVLP